MGIFIDLKKAFDSISHKKLINKLKLIGINGIAISWIISFLDKRPQQVKLLNDLSDAQTSDYSIPQGTVLGPLLFIMYVNDIFEVSKYGEIVSYADDTVLLLKAKTWSELNNNANADINELKMWFDNNVLTLNTKKTHYIPFFIKKNKTPSEINIKIHSVSNSAPHHCNLLCKNIESKSSIKYLGITIDQCLKWLPHITILKNRIRKLTYIFSSLRYILNEQLLRMTYFAFCQSIIQYGIIGWGGAYKTHTQSLYITQKLIIKIILKKPFLYPTEKLFKEFKVRKLNTLFLYHATLQIYKEDILNKNSPFRNTKNLRQKKYFIESSL